jgi:hypothetical protein
MVDQAREVYWRNSRRSGVDILVKDIAIMGLHCKKLLANNKRRPAKPLKRDAG